MSQNFRPFGRIFMKFFGSGDQFNFKMTKRSSYLLSFVKFRGDLRLKSKKIFFGPFSHFEVWLTFMNIRPNG